MCNKEDLNQNEQSIENENIIVDANTNDEELEVI